MEQEKVISKQKVAGNILECPVCGFGEFWTRQAKVNTPRHHLLQLDKNKEIATNYICSSCGHVLWFVVQK